jgi:bifunctional non-homologous end joining protein LigD
MLGGGMALDEYKRRRNFDKTPEPAGSARSRTSPRGVLSFVVQKHAARRLHYDFRLELDGVMKSWAIPKGPSLDPAEKRLAVEVEDHPLDYGGFEGIIPKGEYGGGTVLLWDRGTWTPIEPNPVAALGKGMLKFELQGEKLHGNWMLVRLKRRPRDKHDNWLLVKERDDAALPGSGNAVVEDHPLSVDTNRSIDGVAADRDRVWHPLAGEMSPASAPVKRRLSNLPGTRKAPIPDSVKPQLATAAAEAPAGTEWLHEIKYDGYRLIAHVARGNVRLLTRNGLDWTAKFPTLARRFAEMPVKAAVIDGELVSLLHNGTTSFTDLQNAIAAGRTGQLTFFAFDLLYCDGWDLTGTSLENRKAALAQILPPHADGILRYSDHQEGRGPEFLRQAASFALEGIVSKRRDKPYRGGRGNGWLKIKCRNRDEFIVLGFTEPEGSRQGFGALLLGYYDPTGALRYAGRVGSGFGEAGLLELRTRLDALAIVKPPVSLPQGSSADGVHWTRPRLIAQIQYAGWTADGVVRQASFQGLRKDKNPSEVVYDPVSRAPAATSPTNLPSRPARDGSILFEGVRLSHPDRALFPDIGLNKLDLGRYYAAVSDRALPHLTHRPLTLLRAAGGIAQKAFYQKHVGPGVPDAIKNVAIADETGTDLHPVIEDLPGLVALVQIAVVEIHPWGASVDNIERPDRITFDLDPDEGLPWPRVCEAATVVRAALSGIGLESFVKTTGGKGLHVVVPLSPKLDWDAAKTFTRWVAERLTEQSPEQFTANPAKRARQDRIYIDYLRNTRGATAVGAYSPRARPGAPVSTPVSWEEVENLVRPADLTVLTVPNRVAALTSDPWAEIGKLRQSINARVRRHLGI